MEKCNTIRVDESYVSFQNIDCFTNPCEVIDHLLRITQEPKYSNAYWDQFSTKIPHAYHTRNIKDDPKEEVLYLVCSNAFYIIEMFEESEDEEAIHALEKCEQECC